MFGRGGSASDAKHAQAVQDEFDAYRRNVTEHFGETAEHFRNIGRQYRELYDHMASGAESLCDNDDRARLAFPSLRAIEVVADRDASDVTTDQAASADPSRDAEPADAAAETAEATDDTAAQSRETAADDVGEPDDVDDARHAKAEAGDAEDDTSAGSETKDEAAESDDAAALADAANDADAADDDAADDDLAAKGKDGESADPDALRRAGAT